MNDLIPTQPTSTDDYYTQHARKWTEGHYNNDFWRKQYDKFQELLPSGTILEIGTGGGRDARVLMERGYGYIGIEPSGMADVARELLPEAIIHKIHIEEINITGAFEGFWASASLLHHPKDKIEFALQKIFTALKADGVGFIAIKKHTTDLPDQRVVEDKWGERFFAFWLDSEFIEVLARVGFEVAYKEEVVKGETTWLTYFVRKPKET